MSELKIKGIIMKKILRTFILWIFSGKKEEHITQVKIRELIKEGVEVKQMTLRELGKKIGVEHPQAVKFHLKKVLENYTPHSMCSEHNKLNFMNCPIN